MHYQRLPTTDYQDNQGLPRIIRGLPGITMGLPCDYWGITQRIPWDYQRDYHDITDNVIRDYRQFLSPRILELHLLLPSFFLLGLEDAKIVRYDVRQVETLYQEAERLQKANATSWHAPTPSFESWGKAEYWHRVNPVDIGVQLLWNLFYVFLYIGTENKPDG